MSVEVIKADYSNKDHANEIIRLLQHYALDSMGGGKALSDFTATHLISALEKNGHAFSLLAFEGDKAVGLVNCFMGFSTFKCQPLVNIHDVVVESSNRGNNVSQLMLAKVEEIAQEKGCCKITLEVLEGNTVAQNAYKKFGFAGYELDAAMGKALFWEKGIGSE